MASQLFQKKDSQQENRQLSLLASYTLTLHFGFLTKGDLSTTTKEISNNPPDATGYNIFPQAVAYAFDPQPLIEVSG